MPVGFIVLVMQDFDVIVGMDWLAKYQYSWMDCFNKTVTFKVDEASSGVIF